MGSRSRLNMSTFLNGLNSTSPPQPDAQDDNFIDFANTDFINFDFIDPALSSAKQSWENLDTTLSNPDILGE
jgi:hypothetical protein